MMSQFSCHMMTVISNHVFSIVMVLYQEASADSNP